MNNNGFTLMETLVAVTIGSAITAGAISYQSEQSKEIKAEKLIQEINFILEKVDEKIKEEGLELTNWNNSEWNNESDIVSNLIEDDLGFTLWENREEDGLLMDANINYDNLNMLQNFNFHISFDSNEVFEDNFKYLKKAMISESLKQNEKFSTGHYLMSLYSFSKEEDITTQECLSAPEECGVHFSYNRIGGGEYLRANPDASLKQNEIKDGIVKFIDSKNDSPYKCIPWQKTSDGNWELQDSSANSVSCGIGLYKNENGSAEAFAVDLAVNNGTFETIYVNGLCNSYEVDLENKQLIKKAEKVRCATRDVDTVVADLDSSGNEQFDSSGKLITKTVSQMYQIVENIKANEALIDAVYSNEGKINKLDISNTLEVINTANIRELHVIEMNVEENFNILEELISNGESKLSNITFNEESIFTKNNLVTIKNNTNLSVNKVIESDIYVKGDINVNGDYDLGNLIIDGSLKVNGDTKLSNVTTTNEISANNIATNTTTTSDMIISSLIESISMKAKTGDFENIDMELNALVSKIAAKCLESRVLCDGSL
jgi:prepilin-type N-terminal cleavage/methylation domain-containing protein